MAERGIDPKPNGDILVTFFGKRTVIRFVRAGQKVKLRPICVRRQRQQRIVFPKTVFNGTARRIDKLPAFRTSFIVTRVQFVHYAPFRRERFHFARFHIFARVHLKNVRFCNAIFVRTRQRDFVISRFRQNEREIFVRFHRRAAALGGCRSRKRVFFQKRFSDGDRIPFPHAYQRSVFHFKMIGGIFTNGDFGCFHLIAAVRLHRIDDRISV